MATDHRSLCPNAMPTPNALPASITDRLRPGGQPGNAADAVRVWNALYARFSPLLGPLSTELLFVRALSEHAHAFPWLAQCASPATPRDAFDAFTRCLDDHAPADIVAVNQALLATYIEQMSGLIGERLTARFLDSAFPPDGADKHI